MVARTGSNAIQALAVSGTRRLSAPVATTGTWPRLGAYLQGSTAFPLSATEITNRARNAFLVMTNPTVGYAASDFVASFQAIKAANPNCEIYLYTIPEVQPTTRPGGGGIASTLWDYANSATANGYWARTSYPSGTIVPSGGNNICNQSLVRPISGKYWVDRYIDAVLTDLGLPCDGIMTDDTQNTVQYSFDVNEDGAQDSGTSTTFRILAIASIIHRRDYLANKGKKYLVNGSVGWFDAFTKKGIDDRAAMAGIANGGILEDVIGQYRPGAAVSYGRVFYSTGSVTSLANVRTYPGGATVGSQPPLGTVLQTTFGGWHKDSGGGQIYTNQNSPNCLRSLIEWSRAGAELTEADKIIVQTVGPAPARFNNPNGPSGLWANADKHSRVCVLFSQIVSNYYAHLVWTEQTPSSFGVMSDMDEVRFSWGTPDNSNLGQPQLAVDWGAGTGWGYSNGVYLRKFVGGAFGDTLVVWNPVGNGTKTITLPTSAGISGQWQHFGATQLGQSPQATVNDGTVVPQSFTIVEHDAYVLIQRLS